MKRYTFTFSILLFFFIMLIFPKEVFSGASDGLLLWFQIILPTLLPFIIVSNLLIYTNSISFVSRLFGPLFKKCFQTSEAGSFAILVGFLCGYPMGAKVTSDLIQTNRISKNEGNYLLSFCNNTSPMFIISYVVWQNLKQDSLTFPSILILMCSPILCSFFFRRFYKPCPASSRVPRQGPAAIHTRFDFSLIDLCIMNGFETILKVGGYIILFSVLLSLFQLLPFSFPLFEHVILPAFEITNGIPLLIESELTACTTYVAVLTLTSFGGICSIAQTNSMIQESGLSIYPYILEKLITAMVTSLLAFLYFTFILH